MAMEAPTDARSSGQSLAADDAGPRTPINPTASASPAAEPGGQPAGADHRTGPLDPSAMAIGRVKAVAGTPAAIGADGKEHALQPGDAVYLGEALQAGPGGRVSVALRDGGTLHLGADGRVLLNRAPSAAAADAASPQLYLQQGEIAVLPAAASSEAGGIDLQGPSGEVHGRAPYIARVSADAGLEVTLLPQASGAGDALEVAVDGRSQELRAPFDHLTAAKGDLAPRLEHLDCTDPRLDFAAQVGATDSRCGAEAADDDDLETSPGGDLDADTGTFSVTQPADTFDLKPQAAPLADPSAVDLVGAPVRLSLRSHISDLLLQGTQDFATSSSSSSTDPGEGIDFSLMQLWDPGRTWRGLGNHAELGPATREVPLETGRLITARAGEMAQLEATGAAVRNIEEFLDVDWQLSEIPGGSQIRGSAMRLETPIHLEAGQSVSFDVFFDFADTASSGEDDSVFIDIPLFTISVQGLSKTFIIGDTINDDEIVFSPGWQTITYTAGIAGNYTFGFAIIDDNLSAPSRLYVDDVRLQSGSQFTYAVLESESDNLGGSLQLLVPKPIATDDVITLSAGGLTAIDVATQLLANDRDPDPFDGWRIVGVDTTGTHGRVAIASGRTIVYDPHRDSDPAHNFDRLAAGEVGFDTFKYVLDGGNGERATATVTVRVIGVNDAPTAAPTFVSSSETSENGLAISVANVLAAARDVDSDFTPTSLKVVNAIAASGATVTLGGERGQNLTYDPSGTGAFEYLAASESAEDVITYTISDQHSATATGQVIVTVHGSNDLPTAVNDLAATDQNTAVAIAAAANDTDADRSDRLQVVAIDGTALTTATPVTLASGAMVALAADGGLNYDASGAFAYLAEGQTGSDSFVYRVGDGHGGFADASVAVTITGRNDAPIAAADARDISEDGATSVGIAGLLANDADPDQGDAIRVTAVSDQGSLVHARIEGGALILDPGTRFQYLAEGETAAQIVRYTIADNSGTTATGEITVSVHGANDAPVAVADVVDTVEEHEEKIIRVLANDHDVDLSDTLTITAIGGQPVHAGQTVTLASGAHVTLQPDGTLAYDPTGAFAYLGLQERSTDTFTYSVSDGHGGTAQATVTLGISGVNDAPVAEDDEGGTITQRGSFALDVLANDHDPDAHDHLEVVQVNGKTVTFGNPLYLTGSDPLSSDYVVVSTGGQIAYHAGERFASLGAGETATLTLTYTIRDTLDARDEATLSLTVTGANDAPEAGDDTGYGVDSKTVLDFPAVGGVLANDHDPDHADTIRVTAVEGNALAVGQTIALASGALLTLNADGSFRYDPNGAFNWLKPFDKANDSFTYTVSDDHGGTDTATVAVEVQGHPNEPPTAAADTATTDADAGIRLHVLANDSDPEGAHLQVIGIDDAHKNYVRINPDGTLTYDTAGRFDGLAVGQTATDTFTYTIDDDLGGRATAEVTVTIVGTGSATTTQQTIVESFEQVYGSLVAGWDHEPVTGASADAVSLISGFTGGLAPYGPTHMGTAVLMRADGVSAVGDSPLERYLGLAANGLPNDAGTHSQQVGDGSAAVSGSAIKTEMTFTAADLNAQGKLIVSFDWNFISAESVGSGQPGFNDYAVFTVSDGSTSKVLTLSDARETGLGASGWRTSTYELTSLFGADIAAGRSLTLGFAVINDQDNQRASSLLLDNVRINTPVAVDATLLRSGEGGAFLTYRHAPTAGADASPMLATSEDAPLTFDSATLTVNDKASPGTSSISFVGLDGAAGKGAVSYSGGQIIYNPNGTYDALALGEVGTDSFHYQITDANGGIGRGEVTVQITGLNDAPTTTAFVAAGAAAENGVPFSIADVLAHVDDIDADDSSATLRILSASAASGAEVQLSGDRGQSFIYDPSTTAAFEPLGIGETSSDLITYTVVDRHGGTATGQVTVTIEGANDAPTAHADALAADEDHIADLAALANDSDPDRNDTLKVVKINGQAISFGNPVALASGALVLLTTDGRLQFDANHAYDRLAAGQSETTSFTYTASDGHGGFADAVVALTITGLNDLPVAAADTMTADEDHAAGVSLATFLANDHDPDSGDLLQLVGVQGTGASLNSTTLTYDPGNRFHSLGVGETATEHLTYTVTDSHGATSQGDITVTIEGRNDAPDAVADTAATREDEAVTIAPLANDIDPDTSDRGHLTVLSIDTQGTQGTVSLNADGTIRYDPAGQFNALIGGQTATDTFRYTVSDGHGGTDVTTVTMTIEGRNSVEQIIQSFEAPFFFGSDPAVTRVNTFASTVTTYKETDVTPQRTYAPTDGSSMVRLEANGSLIGTVESFLGLSTGSIKSKFPDADGSSPANSSAMKAAIAVHAGDQISFDWMFDARDYVNNPPDGKADNDMAVLAVTGADGVNLYKLADVRQTGDLGATGWRSSAYTAQHDGTITIGLASINDRFAETAQNSVLLIDNIRLNRDFDQGYQLVQTSSDSHLHTYAHT